MSILKILDIDIESLYRINHFSANMERIPNFVEKYLNGARGMARFTKDLNSKNTKTSSAIMRILHPILREMYIFILYHGTHRF